MKHDAPSPRLSGEAPNRCWFRIGVWGDGRCEDLEGFVHCFNCPVYQNAGKALFSRVPSPGYIDEAAEVLKEPDDSPSVAEGSHLVFFIGEQRFALSASAVRAVAPFSKVHSVPFRTNKLFLGLIPFRGKLRLCYSLAEALDLGEIDLNFRRMLLLGAPDASFVIPVSDVEGLTIIADAEKYEEPPNGLESNAWVMETVLSGEDSIVVLDEEAILDTFSKKQL